MPIKSENKSLYPSNWAEIRSDILKRAVNRCEFCGVKNYSTREGYNDGRSIKIVLAIAHLDQNPENNDFRNLRALCQRCHNRLDMPHRIRHAKLTRWKKK